MSSSGSPPAAGDRPESRSQTPTTWHPAREWLEADDDENDMDFEPESEFSEDHDALPDLYNEDEEDGLADEDADFHAAGFGTTSLSFLASVLLCDANALFLVKVAWVSRPEIYISSSAWTTLKTMAAAAENTAEV